MNEMDRVLPNGVAPNQKRVLVVAARLDRCALPLEHVVETMRPLPIESVANAGPHVLGISIVRGIPLPVIDLGALLSPGRVRPSAAGATRFVTLRAGARRVALAVEAVLGVRALEASTLHALPPLLGAVDGSTITALGVLDYELIAVLDSSRLFPQDSTMLAGAPNNQSY